MNEALTAAIDGLRVACGNDDSIGGLLEGRRRRDAAEAEHGVRLPEPWRSVLPLLGVPPKGIPFESGTLDLDASSALEHQLNTDDGRALAAEGWTAIMVVDGIGDCIVLRDDAGVARVAHRSHTGETREVGELTAFLDRLAQALDGVEAVEESAARPSPESPEEPRGEVVKQSSLRGSLATRSHFVLTEGDSDRTVALNPSMSEKVVRDGSRQVRSFGGRHGSRVLIGGGAHEAFVFDLETGEVGPRMGPFQTQYVRALDVSADGRRALVGSEQNELCVFDFETGAQLGRLDDGESHMAGLFFAGGEWVVSGALLKQGLGFWRVGDGAFALQGDVKQPLHMTALDGSSLVVAFHDLSTVTWQLERSIVEAWDPSAQERLWSVPIQASGAWDKITSIDVSRDGTIVAVGSLEGRLHLIVEGELSTVVPLAEQRVKLLRFRRSIAGDELLVLTGDWVLRCFDVSDPSSPDLLFEHTLDSHGCGGSSWEQEGRPVMGGDRLVFCDREPTVYVCDVVTGQELGSFPSADLTGMTIWEDGWLLTQTKSGRVDVVELPDVPAALWVSPTLADAPAPMAEPLVTEKEAPIPAAPAAPRAEKRATPAKTAVVAFGANPAKLARLRALARDPKASKTARLEASVRVLQEELSLHVRDRTMGPPELMERASNAMQEVRKRHRTLKWDLALPLFQYIDLHSLREDGVTLFLDFLASEKLKSSWPELAIHRIPEFVTDPRIQAVLARKVPKAIANRQSAVNATLRPRFAFSGRAGWRSSRVEPRLGGEPGLPKGVAWPRDRSGRPMHFLAQFACDLVRQPSWPKKGLLLFFVSNDAFLSLRGPCSVLHVDAMPQSALADVSAELREVRQFEYQPIEKPGPMQVHASMQPISTGDYRFGTVVPTLSTAARRSWHKRAFFMKSSNQVGGYPFFTQEDVRSVRDDPETDVLLLQLDTDYEFGTRWGDNGVVHFFISSADLAAGDFSRVRFSGDCM